MPYLFRTPYSIVPYLQVCSLVIPPLPSLVVPPPPIFLGGGGWLTISFCPVPGDLHSYGKSPVRGNQPHLLLEGVKGLQHVLPVSMTLSVLTFAPKSLLPSWGDHRHGGRRLYDTRNHPPMEGTVQPLPPSQAGGYPRCLSVRAHTSSHDRSLSSQS